MEEVTLVAEATTRARFQSKQQGPLQQAGPFSEIRTGRVMATGLHQLRKCLVRCQSHGIVEAGKKRIVTAIASAKRSGLTRSTQISVASGEPFRMRMVRQ